VKGEYRRNSQKEMIVNNEESVLVSSLGWVDKSSIWVFDVCSEDIEQFQLSDAKHLSIHLGKEDLFSVVHHYEANKLEMSAHSFAEPASPLSKFTIEDGKKSFDGKLDIWNKLPKAYIAYYEDLTKSDFFLFIVDGVRGDMQAHHFDWYDDSSYDKGYQGIVGVTEVPGKDILLVSVQRCSELVIYDPEGKRILGKIKLGDRSGNPIPRFRKTEKELWVNDYDTLLRLDTSNWGIKNSRRLQEEQDGCGKFIGAYAFNRMETLCAVARPFSSDVVALDTKSFKVRYRAETGGMPIECALLSDGRVFARDWKTGELLKGSLTRK
jgi:hypothetical protein